MRIFSDLDQITGRLSNLDIYNSHFRAPRKKSGEVTCVDDIAEVVVVVECETMQ